MNDRNPRVNALGQPIGFDIPDWRPPPRPPRTVLTGRYCLVEPLEPARHGPDLHAAYSLDHEGRLWTYLFSGPFVTEGEFMQWLAPRQHPKIRFSSLLLRPRPAGLSDWRRT